MSVTTSGDGGGDRSRWLPPGTRLNDIYEIEEGIAAGGMGEIYRGRAIETGDLVAIKTIRWDVADTEAALGMFRREASALHNLYHEAIVRYYVFSIDRVLNRPYLAMEFVSGPSLSDLLKNGPLDFDSVRVLGARVAAGLQAAHERGIIHRDMSPDNIILPDGDVSRAKIIDFGIARQTKQSEGTIIGDGFAGKYNYVSPEQLGMHGGEVTGASDIYSLGLVLVEAIAGRPLNMRGNPVEVVEKRQRVPDIAHVDARLRLLIARMLQSSPQDRPQSMREVSSWLRRGGGTIQPASPSFDQAEDDDHEDRTIISLAPRSRAPAPRGSPPEPAAAERSSVASEPQKKSSVPVAALAAGVAALLALGGGGAYFLSSGSAPKEVAVATQPVATPERARPSVQPETQTAQAVRPRAAPRPDATAADVAAYVARYAAGDCVFVTPVALGDRRLVADGFARQPGDLDAMRRDADSTLGFNPEIRPRQVTRSQCPVVDMLAASARGAGPRLEVASVELKPGDVMMGEASPPPGAYVGVARVGPDGAVQILAAAAKPSEGFLPFEAAIDNASAGSPQLIVAFASPQPVLSLPQGATMSASDFVAKLSGGPGGLVGAARYVSVTR